MNLHKVINSILHIPHDFHKLNNISIYTLLKESGYFEIYSLVSVEDIRVALVSEPWCAEEWLIYSEDKRCNSGWYFIKTKKHKYLVGYYPSGDRSCTMYDNHLDACAIFIKREIEDIRQQG